MDQEAQRTFSKISAKKINTWGYHILTTENQKSLEKRRRENNLPIEGEG